MTHLSWLAIWICVGVALLARIAWWIRTRRHRGVFRLSPCRDDCFTCRGPCQEYPVSIESDGFELPAMPDGIERTVFLTMHVQSTLMGRFGDPFFEISQGEVRYRQYFERSAVGRRQLNLSPLFAEGRQSAVARVHLRGRGIRWQEEATLMLFDSPDIRDAEILVLAPHPDDAEIAAFGLYRSHRSWVATITAGEMGASDLSHVLSPGDDASRWNACLRVWDSLTIPQFGDVPPERCLNLVYPDTQLKQLREQPDRPTRIACEDSLSRRTLRSRNRALQFKEAEGECTWNGLVNELRRLLDQAKPRVVVCPHPLIDEHSDHVFTAVALAEAVHELPHTNILFLLYVVHRRDTPLYPCGPASAVVALPPWTEQQWLAESVYSHALAPEVRTAKFFAIEAAHGLRACADDDPKSVGRALVALKRELSALLGGVGLRPTSFLRRGPRPNEIFFVASAEAFAELVRRALTKHAVSRGS